MFIGSFAPDDQWSTVNADLGDGRLALYRCFDGEIPVAGVTPANGGAKWKKVPSGVRAFYSMKTKKVGGVYDWTGTINGDYDHLYAPAIAEIPAGTMFTVLHEPEDDANVTGQIYRAVFEKIFDLCTTHNPNIEVWSVLGHFWWGSRWDDKPNYVGDTEAIEYQAVADLAHGVGLDVYNSAWYMAQNGNSNGLIQNDSGFQRWADKIASRNGNWGIPENGDTAEGGEQARADRLYRNAAYLNDSGCRLLSYWQQDQSSNAGDKFKIGPGVGRTAYRSLAALSDRI